MYPRADDRKVRLLAALGRSQAARLAMSKGRDAATPILLTGDQGASLTGQPTNIRYPGDPNFAIQMPGAQALSTADSFFAHTLIETELGQVPVEALTLGQRVVTLDQGLQTIRWIGRSKLTPAQHFGPRRCLRVRRPCARWARPNVGSWSFCSPDGCRPSPIRRGP